jgi:hypothetical protein
MEEGWATIAIWKGLIFLIALGFGIQQLVSVRRDMRRAGDARRSAFVRRDRVRR